MPLASGSVRQGLLRNVVVVHTAEAPVIVPHTTRVNRLCKILSCIYFTLVGVSLHIQVTHTFVTPPRVC